MRRYISACIDACVQVYVCRYAHVCMYVVHMRARARVCVRERT